MNPLELAELISGTIRHEVGKAGTTTEYRDPLFRFIAADAPQFHDLRRVIHPDHRLPDDLLPGARSVVSYFLPFASWVVEANAQDKVKVAREWAVAYVETNTLIGRINERLIQSLAKCGVRAAAEPATHNFDPVSLVSRWSHKSVAVIAGLGSFGLHQMVITDAGCAGRFGSLVLDAELPYSVPTFQLRCLFFYDGSCLECVQCCPVQALDTSQPLDKRRCYQHLLSTAAKYEIVGIADVCGKCALGPCSLRSAVEGPASRAMDRGTSV
ncbi:MAG: epoxyqueuosine reductase [Anaerolineae bacterium]